MLMIRWQLNAYVIELWRNEPIGESRATNKSSALISERKYEYFDHESQANSRVYESLSLPIVYELH